MGKQGRQDPRILSLLLLADAGGMGMDKGDREETGPQGLSLALSGNGWWGMDKNEGQETKQKQPRCYVTSKFSRFYWIEECSQFPHRH